MLGLVLKNNTSSLISHHHQHITSPHTKTNPVQPRLQAELSPKPILLEMPPTPASSSCSSSSPPGTISAALLEILLRGTKFVGLNRVPVLDGLFAWTAVAVFGTRYLFDYAKLRWRLRNIARRHIVVATAAEESSSSSAAAALALAAAKSNNNNNNESATLLRLCDCVPLCPLAHTGSEMSVSVQERWEKLKKALIKSQLPTASLDETRDDYDKKNKTKTNNEAEAPFLIAQMTKEWTDKDWIQAFHSNLSLRRETSYLMHKLSSSSSSSSSSRGVNNNNNDHQQQYRGDDSSSVLSKLRRLWPQFMELPESAVSFQSCDRDDGDDYRDNREENNNNNNSRNDRVAAAKRRRDISLIIPTYRESAADIARTLQGAINNCTDGPKNVQVIVVHIQSRPDDNFDPNKISSSTSSSSSWGELKIVTVPYGKGRGRGNTLNIGASHAKAPILTFLHADTAVPVGWDLKIKEALLLKGSSSSNSNNNNNNNGKAKTFFPHACAFTMAIDDRNKASCTAAGLLGAEWLGVLRCHCGLPYGDSVLSFSRPMFDYMGGFPEQPLMEDYEVMDWLRLRSVLINTMHRMRKDSAKPNVHASYTIEGLALLPDRARCSPRRWQKYGVAHTSLVNAICIFRYRGNATAEDLFDFYYHCNSASKTSK